MSVLYSLVYLERKLRDIFKLVDFDRVPKDLMAFLDVTVYLV